MTAAAHVIAITGSSRSGKTTLARKMGLQLQHDGVKCKLIAQDDGVYRAWAPTLLPNGRTTWEGPQFTDWAKLHAAVAAAREQFEVVILEGYLVLDCLERAPALAAIINAVLWVESSKEIVVRRRTSFPRGGNGAWKSAQAYAAECVWPVHEAYVSRVFHHLQPQELANRPDGSRPWLSAILPADESAEARLKRAYGIVTPWLKEQLSPPSPSARVITLAQTAASSSSTAPLIPFAPSVPRTCPLVLVTHGSMNPIHRGHIAMMVRAKEALEKEGFTVVKGVMAITNENHIRGKGVEPMEVPQRLTLIGLMCKSEGQSDWLSHCNGQGMSVGSAVWYVGKHLHSFKQQYGPNTLMVTVEGSDVFSRYSNGYKPNRIGELDLKVIAMREGETVDVKGVCKERAANVLLLPPDPTTADFSSTRVREAIDSCNKEEFARLCGQRSEVAQLLK